MTEVEEVPLKKHALKFDGNGSDYFSIWIVNTLLTIITLGFYSPWAKVRKLQYLARVTSLGKGRFDFHGDPKAILKGRILALVTFGLYSFGSSINQVFAIVGVILIYIAIPWIFIKSQKFKMTNTSYRGVRFSFRATNRDGYKIWKKYAMFPALLIIGFAILNMILFQAPVNEAKSDPLQLLLLGAPNLILLIYVLVIFSSFYNAVLKFQYDHIYYGGKKVKIKSSVESVSKNIHRAYIKSALLSMFVGIGGVVVLGIIVVKLSIIPKSILPLFTTSLFLVPYFIMIGLFVKFKYLVINYVWNNLKLDNKYKTKTTIEFMDYLKVVIKNVVGLGFTLGIYHPWATVAHQKYILENRYIDMDDFDQFTQEAQDSVTTLGEELADIFDFDFELGL